MRINKDQWLTKIAIVQNSLDQAIVELRNNQSAHHSARVMRHRLEGKRYVLDFMRSIIADEDVHPMTVTHVWHQYLAEYPNRGCQIQDDIHFNVGENAFEVMRRHPSITLEKLRTYLSQFGCSFDTRGNIKEDE